MDVAGQRADTGEEWVALLPPSARGEAAVPFLERNVAAPQVLVRWRFATDDLRSEEVRRARAACRARRLAQCTHVRVLAERGQGLR